MTTTKPILITSGTGYIGGRGYLKNTHRRYAGFLARSCPRAAPSTVAVIRNEGACRRVVWISHLYQVGRTRPAGVGFALSAERFGGHQLLGWHAGNSRLTFQSVLAKSARKYGRSFQGGAETFPVEHELECKL